MSNGFIKRRGFPANAEKEWHATSTSRCELIFSIDKLDLLDVTSQVRHGVYGGVHARIMLNI